MLYEGIRRLITFAGDNPDREGLRDTPDRVLDMYKELCSGYQLDPKYILTEFGQPHDEMIILRNVEFVSLCEHHLLPFYGVAHIGYIPSNGRVVGISKLARLLDIFAKRLQIQERICNQVTKALMDHLQCLGAGCVLVAKHQCMICRGVRKQESEMVTSSLLGIFRERVQVRTEFLSLIGV